MVGTGSGSGSGSGSIRNKLASGSVIQIHGSGSVRNIYGSDGRWRSESTRFHMISHLVHSFLRKIRKWTWNRSCIFILLYFLYAGPVHTQTPYRQRGQRCFPSFFKINTVRCQCWFCIRTVWRTKPPTRLGQGYKNTTHIVFNKYALSYLLLMFAGFFVKHVSSDIKPTVLYPRLYRVISKQQNTKYK